MWGWNEAALTRLQKHSAHLQIYWLTAQIIIETKQFTQVEKSRLIQLFLTNKLQL